MSDQSHIDEIFADYLRRLDAHEPVDIAQFLRQHPDIATELGALIETARQIEDMAGPQLDATGLDQSLEETIIHSGDQSANGSKTPTDDNSPRGKELGDYRLLDELGRGGMGVVYLAEQISMGRQVALKMIRSGALASENDVQRFYFEAQAAGRLKHPLIVQVYQVGEIDGHHYFSMEYIEGRPLSQVHREQTLSPQEIAAHVRDIAEAVDFAHKHGVLHRDLKPSNIMIDVDGRPRVTDFGLAKDMEASDNFTSSGSAVGTPSYMSPEQAQARRDEITCQSDVYSLGAILYALLTGGPPFRADSLLDTLTQVIHDEPRPPRLDNKDCPRDLEAICLKCLQKSPANRYETAHQLAEDLERFLQGERVLAGRSTWYKRTWHWLRNVPFIAAALGRKSTNPTPWHLRFQWGTVALVIATLGGLFAVPPLIESSRLSTVEIATGDPSRSYDRIGRALAEDLRRTTDWEITTVPATGAVESHDWLYRGKVDLAFLQENTLEKQELKVVAPLYREVVLAIVRSDSGIDDLAQLPGRKVSLGKQGSGSRLSNERILQHFNIDVSTLSGVDETHQELLEDDQLQAAIVTGKLDDPSLLEVLETGDFHLLPFPEDDEVPGFRLRHIRPHELPPGVVPNEQGVTVPATFAILAVRAATPDQFVLSCLETLYGNDGVATQFDDVFTLEQAAAWNDLRYHAAAQRYFAEARDKAKPTTHND